MRRVRDGRSKSKVQEEQTVLFGVLFQKVSRNKFGFKSSVGGKLFCIYLVVNYELNFSQKIRSDEKRGKWGKDDSMDVDSDIGTAMGADACESSGTNDDTPKINPLKWTVSTNGSS